MGLFTKKKTFQPEDASRQARPITKKKTNWLFWIILVIVIAIVVYVLTQ
jgi:t-SNARE complex subunit (syntaxin)